MHFARYAVLASLHEVLHAMSLALFQVLPAPKLMIFVCPCDSFRPTLP